jgi:hypothetical protein
LLVNAPAPVQDQVARQAPIRVFIELIRRESVFIALLLVAFLITGLTYQTPHIAMWVGFVIAAYSAVANDSIQTLGTFIASNKHRPWWLLWLFMGGIFLATAAYSWVNYGGDVSYGRLASKGFETAPTEFQWLQVAAPLVLLILTRMRMPVSTTFLLLSCFAASGKSIWAITAKSLTGYGIAFGLAILLWVTLGRYMQRKFVGKAHPAWNVGQWVISGALWSVWLQQDAANVAVYLPRSLSVWQFAAFAGVIFGGLGLLFWQGGERIQKVVDEKSNVVDVRAATVIDLLYAIILYIFKVQSDIPMSTTWVFVGLLAGREIGMSFAKAHDRPLINSFKLMGKDLLNVGLGFVISLVLASAINPTIRAALFE